MDETRYSYRFVTVVAIFIACIITANIIAVKLVNIFGFILPAAVLIFPISYITGDILTEVYGYRQARKVIWLGFLCNFFTVLAIWLGQIIPAAPFWDGQEAYARILGYAPRLLFASFVAYLAGAFSNSYLMAKIKIATRGRFLWIRTIGSTLAGQGLDSFIFIILAFAGTMTFVTLVSTVITQWLVKCAYEIAVTPLTYVVVGYLKKKEGIDIYDHDTRFNPLLISD
ncbi:MAG: queuosine precursor transporter [Deltaproteobacteria bacterium]|nr:queuosine precursor transporter [Deltaproteobacteria bacterium]